jgi:hypothetical protein
MARALTRTWLPLDEWARFHGFDPLHFNGVSTSGGHPVQSNCDRIWTQHHWQRGQVGREDVATAIEDAEAQIADLLKTNLIPDWNEERIPVTGHWQAGIIQTSPWQFDGTPETVNFPRRNWIMGGERATEILGDAAAVVFATVDSFDDNRFATITVPGVAADLNVDQVRLFFEPDPDLDIGEADPAWEIRPLRSVDLTGTTLTITVNREKLVNPALVEAPPEDFEGINGDVDLNFVTEVDVARVYNDPQNQVQLEWLPDEGSGGCGSCVACQLRSQTGCILGADRENGILSFAPAEWDASTETFATRNLAVCRQPDRLLVRSFSGRMPGTSRGETYNPQVAMDRWLLQAVAILSAAQLVGEPCGCEAAARVQSWQEEMDANLADKSFSIGFNELRNPLGMTKGAVHVWRRLKREQVPSFNIGAISR